MADAAVARRPARHNEAYRLIFKTGGDVAIFLVEPSGEPARRQGVTPDVFGSAA